MTSSLIRGPLAAPPPPVLSTFRGLWWADETVDVGTSPTVARFIPNANAVGKVPVPSNTLMLPRRNFGRIQTFWSRSNVTVTDSNAVGPDGLTEASTVVINPAGGSWLVRQRPYTAFVNGPYTMTMGCWVRLASGSGTFKFGKQFGTAATSSAFTPTSTWQRFSWTTTFTSQGDDAYLGDLTASPTMTIEICDFTCYPGSVDLGAEPLVGHIRANNNSAGGLFTYSSGLVTAQNQWGTIAFGPRYRTDKLTVMCSAVPLSTWNDRSNHFKAWACNAEDDSFAMGNSCSSSNNTWGTDDALPGLDLGPLNGGSNTHLGEFQQNPFLFDCEGQNLAVFAHTWDRDTGLAEGWVNGVKLLSTILTVTTPSAVSRPGFQDLFFNLYAHTSHPSYHQYAMLGIADYVLTDAQIRDATKQVQARVAKAGNTATTMPKILIVEGDQVANSTYPYTAATTMSPRVRGANYGTTNATIATLTARLSRIAGIVAQAPYGTKVIVYVDIGRWDTGMGTGGSAAVLSALTTYLTALGALGCTRLVATMISCTHSNQSQFDTDRAAFNTGVRAMVGVNCEGVVDLAADATMGPDAARLDSSLFTSGIVPTKTTGSNLLAPYLVTAVNAVP